MPHLTVDNENHYPRNQYRFFQRVCLNDDGELCLDSELKDLFLYNTLVLSGMTDTLMAIQDTLANSNYIEPIYTTLTDIKEDTAKIETNTAECCLGDGNGGGTTNPPTYNCYPIHCTPTTKTVYEYFDSTPSPIKPKQKRNHS